MQRKLNDHVYSFVLFVPSRPDYQAEFYSLKSGPLHRCLRLVKCFFITPLLCHWSILGQDNAQNTSPCCTVESYFVVFVVCTRLTRSVLDEGECIPKTKS